MYKIKKNFNDIYIYFIVRLIWMRYLWLKISPYVEE